MLDFTELQNVQGASARCIAAHMLGLSDAVSGNYPHDAGDFGRCEVILSKFPEFRQRISEMAEVNAYWAALVPRWDEIRQASDKNALISSIVKPIEKADPNCAAFGPNATLRVGSKITFRGNPDLRAAEQASATKGSTPMKETPEDEAVRAKAYGVAADELRQFVERYEQLEAEKKDIAEQQKEVMAEAKGRGYDTKALRKIISLRKQRPDDVAEQEAILDIYKSALGME